MTGIGGDDLTLVLWSLADELDSQAARSQSLEAESERQLAELDALAESLDELGIARTPSVEPAEASPMARPGSPSAPAVPWAELELRARSRLDSRGVQIDEASLDGLLDPDEVEAIERRFSARFELRADLDRYDILAAVSAGLVAALVDFLLVRIPRDTLLAKEGLSSQFFERGSPLTKFLQRHSFPHDNPLSRICKTPFDHVKGVDVPGLGGQSHRYHTLGHDPLLGLVFGTIDIMRGALTAIDWDGNLLVRTGLGPQHSNPLIAFPVELLHLLSDAPTRMGIPPPGWALTGLAQFGSIGPQDLSVAQTARQMYLGGYDSRHFLVMSTAPAAAEAVLRLYWGVRRTLDDQFREDVNHAGIVADTGGRISKHPRYQAMSLNANVLACAANAGKVACYGAAGPYAINYAQWLHTLRALTRFARSKMVRPTDVLIGHGRANMAALERGWPLPDDWSEAPPLALPG